GLEVPARDVQALARALGAVRDLDVSAERLNASIELAPPERVSALQRLREDRLREREPARRELLEALDSGLVSRISVGFGGRLRAELRADVLSGKKARIALRKASVSLVGKGLRRLCRAGKQLQAPTSEELHEIRIEAKRFRYLCEFLKPVFGEALDEPISRATMVQDALGELHDVDVLVPALLDDADRLSVARPEDIGAVTGLAREALDRREQSLEAFRSAWAAMPKRKALRRRMSDVNAADHAVDGNHYPL
ncbi:MAG TPA: CHAD domain-containing protein, partial [Chloroflexota bacterium]|nr:CHAD domain-containing protein [Chloroflexota bacterium]